MRTYQPSDSLLDGNSREFKVRIVERLSQLEHRLNHPNDFRNNNTNANNESKED